MNSTVGDASCDISHRCLLLYYRPTSSQYITAQLDCAWTNSIAIVVGALSLMPRSALNSDTLALAKARSSMKENEKNTQNEQS